MSKYRESAADRVWREKVDPLVSFREAAIVVVVTALVAVALFVGF